MELLYTTENLITKEQFKAHSILLWDVNRNLMVCGGLMVGSRVIYNHPAHFQQPTPPTAAAKTRRTLSHSPQTRSTGNCDSRTRGLSDFLVIHGLQF